MKNEICISPDVLGMPGEDGSVVAPEMGDEVEATMTGKVTRLEDGKAYIEVTTVNGEPVMKENAEKEGEGMMSDEDAEEEIKKLNDEY